MSNQFHNIKPRTRNERLSVKDKESWEKDRLARRKGGFVRIDTSVTGAAMTEYCTNAQGYMADAERFHTDTAGEAKIEREAKNTRQRMIVDQKRFDHLEKDEKRWQKLEQKQVDEDAKWDRHREEGVKALRNKSSVPFDPITLRYNADPAGEQLKHSDNQVKQRAAMRAVSLRNNSCRSGVNPITGQPLG